jgi:hypothetical protein
MTSRIERWLIALVFALLAARVTLIIASAQSGTVPPVQTSSDCATCHAEVQTTWQNGSHGKAGSDPIFLDDWSKQGKPTACLACHPTGYDPATGTYQADGVERAPHTAPDHSFQANIASCNTCHAQQMHSAAEATNTKEADATIAIEPTPEIELASITPTPSAVSPIGYSAMAGLIGLVGGMVLAPWLERWYRRVGKQNREEQDD